MKEIEIKLHSEIISTNMHMSCLEELLAMFQNNVEKLVKAQNQAIEQHPTQNLKTLALTGNLKISRISALRVYFQCDTSLALGNSIDRT
jgi:hypothetical protein